MPCNCEKEQAYSNTEIEDIRKMAETEAGLEKRDYIIYKYNDQYYYEGKKCWEKAGGKGVVIEYVYYEKCSYRVTK